MVYTVAKCNTEPTLGSQHYRFSTYYQIVTEPAKTGHVGTNYIPSLYRSYLSIGKVYFHSVTCVMMPIKCLLRTENCSAIA